MVSTTLIALLLAPLAAVDPFDRPPDEFHRVVEPELSFDMRPMGLYGAHT